MVILLETYRIIGLWAILDINIGYLVTPVFREVVINGHCSDTDLVSSATHVKTYSIIAGENLAIAQHRDTFTSQLIN